MNTVGRLLAGQFAESLESCKALRITLQDALRCGANEKDIARLYLFAFRPDADLARASRADDDARAIDGFERSLCPFII